MKSKMAHKLTEGTVITFSMGGDYENIKVATVRSVEVDGNYVTVWFRENGELGYFLADKTSEVEVIG